MSGATVLVRARLDKTNESDIAYPNGQSEAKLAIPDAKALLGGPAPSEFVLAAPGGRLPADGDYVLLLGAEPGGRVPDFLVMGTLGLFPVDAKTGAVSRYCVTADSGAALPQEAAPSVEAFTSLVARSLSLPQG